MVIYFAKEHSMETIKIRKDYSERVQYIHSDFPIYIRKGILSKYPNYQALSHWHEDIEFIYVLSGSMDYDINGQIVSLHEKEGILVNSKNFHFGFSDHQECIFICILIHPDLFSTNPMIDSLYVQPFISNLDLPYLLLKKERWQLEILQIIQTLYQLDQKDAHFFLDCQQQIVKLFSILYKHRDPQSHAPSWSKLELLRVMVNFIQDQFDQNISLDDIAKSANIGKTTCCKLFNTYMHTTPIEYVLTYRMEQAYTLLEESDRSITDIAYAVGFHDSSYFTKIFKNYYHTTPKSIRQKK